MHIVEQHIVSFIKSRGEERGLGFYSEQSMEAAHTDYGEEWDKEAVPEEHSEYSDRLKRATVRFNGKRFGK